MDNEVQKYLLKALETSCDIDYIKKEIYKTMDEIESEITKFIDINDNEITKVKTDDLFEKLKKLMFDKVKLSCDCCKELEGKPNFEGLISLVQKKHFQEERIDSYTGPEMPIMP